MSTPDTPICLDDHTDLCHSPDDEAATGRGWYLQRFPDHATSGLYASAEAATEAWRKGEAVFTD